MLGEDGDLEVYRDWLQVEALTSVDIIECSQPRESIEEDMVNNELQHVMLSLYSLIGDFFMIWRLIKDFKSDILFSACFDYDINTYYI